MFLYRRRQNGGVSACGRREQNEDCLLLLPDLNVFGVIDGMGGRSSGQLAAGCAQFHFERAFRESSSLPPMERMAHAFAVANNAVREFAAGRRECNGMGAVATVIQMEGDRVTVGHVGDTRLYAIDRNGLRQITDDHAPTPPAGAKRFTTNLVLKFLGAAPRTLADHYFDVFQFRCDPATGLLLTSDGIHDVLSPDQIRTILKQHRRDAAETARQLMLAARALGSSDNMSALYVSPLRLHTVPRSLAAVAAAAIPLMFYLHGLDTSIPAPPAVPRLRHPPITVGREQQFPTLDAALTAAQPGDEIFLLDSKVCAPARVIPMGVKITAARPLHVVSCESTR